VKNGGCTSVTCYDEKASATNYARVVYIEPSYNQKLKDVIIIGSEW
jgi:hypothetical protein